MKLYNVGTFYKGYAPVSFTISLKLSALRRRWGWVKCADRVTSIWHDEFVLFSEIRYRHVWANRIEFQCHELLKQNTIWRF